MSGADQTRPSNIPPPNDQDDLLGVRFEEHPSPVAETRDASELLLDGSVTVPEVEREGIEESPRLRELRLLIRDVKEDSGFAGMVQWEEEEGEESDEWIPLFDEWFPHFELSTLRTSPRDVELERNVLVRVQSKLRGREIVSIYLGGKDIARSVGGNFRIFSEAVRVKEWIDFCANLRKICQEEGIEYRVFEPEVEFKKEKSPKQRRTG